MPKLWQGLGKAAFGLISWSASIGLVSKIHTTLAHRSALPERATDRKWHRQSRCHLTQDLVIHLGFTTTESIDKSVSLFVGLVGGMASMSAVISSPALVTEMRERDPQYCPSSVAQWLEQLPR